MVSRVTVGDVITKGEEGEGITDPTTAEFPVMCRTCRRILRPWPRLFQIRSATVLGRQRRAPSLGDSCAPFSGKGAPSCHTSTHPAAGEH